MSLIDLLKKLKPANELADVSLTPRAQQALMLARKEALRLSHNYIGTEHALLGLIKLGRGVAVDVLGNLGLDLENVRAELEKLIGNTPDEKMFGNAPYTPRMKRVLQMAKDEARALHHTYIGTEHLFLALLREREGLAAEIFQKFQLDIEQVHKAVLKELDPNFDGGQKG